MIWISTPFSRAAADFLETLDVPAYKIGSGEADNLPLIRHIARKGKPVIMSTGMQTIETLRASVAILDEAGVDYALLECTNLYPSPAEIVSLAGRDGVAEGLSEGRRRVFRPFHRAGNGAGLGGARRLHSGAALHRHALPQGAGYHQFDGPGGAALPDRPLARKSGSRRTTPKSGAPPRKSVYRFARASVVADRDLPEGHVIAEADIWARRPGSGEIAGYDFDKVRGQAADPRGHAQHPVEMERSGVIAPSGRIFYSA